MCTVKLPTNEMGNASNSQKCCKLQVRGENNIDSYFLFEQSFAVLGRHC